LKTLKNIVLSAIAVLSVVFVAGCSKDDLTIVKKGHVDFNKSIAIGKALDGYKYFEKKEWQAVKTPQGARIVFIKADMNPQFIKEINEACNKSNTPPKTIESQKWSIQFTINKDNTVHVSGTQTLTIFTDKSKKAGSLTEALLKSVFENQLAVVCM
jgi:hypothetical protein